MELEGALDSDWLTLGEALELDEEAVETFMRSLVWSATEVHAEGRRPLQLHRWTDARAREEVAELDERDLDVPAAVRERLRGVTQVIAIEIGFSQLDTMLETVAFEIGYWLRAPRRRDPRPERPMVRSRRPPLGTLRRRGGQGTVSA